MAIVPQYQRDRKLRPNYQNNWKVRANAEHFGAAVGRGLAQVGSGISQAGSAMATLKSMEAAADARDQQNDLSADITQLLNDPDKGFLLREGKDAVRSFESTRTQLKQAAHRRSKGLFGEAKAKFDADADLQMTGALRRAIRHKSQQQVNHISASLDGRISDVQQSILLAAGDADLQAGFGAEAHGLITEKARLQGWSDDQLSEEKRNFASATLRESVLHRVEANPAAALDDYDLLRPHLIETDRQELDLTFSLVRKEEEVKSHVAGILSRRRHANALPAEPQGLTPETEGDTLSINSVPYSYLNAAHPVADRRLDQDLTDAFATNLDALLEDAPEDIRSGLELMTAQGQSPGNQSPSDRSPGDRNDTAYWVAQQGERAVRIRYDGRSLSEAPDEVKDWIADKAGSYGLSLPVGSSVANKTPDERVADGFDTRLVASLDSPVARASGPSMQQMEEALAAINNPEIKEAARTHLQIEMDKQSRAEKEGQLAASRELWAAIDNGGSLEDVPVATRVAAGSATIADATDYIRNRESGKIIRSDVITLSELNRMMAQKPDRFIAQDLDAYRNLLSRADLKILKQSQSGLLQQDSQILKQSEIYEAAFEQADQLLQQLGLSGPNGETDQQKARFLNNLKFRLDHQIAQGNFDAPEPDLLPSLIRSQLAADFPQQAAQLQALEEALFYPANDTNPSSGEPQLRRGSNIPFARNTETDEVSLAWPQSALDAWEAFKLPGDVYSGKVDLSSDEAQERLFDLTTSFTGGSFIPRRPAGSIGMGGRRLAHKTAPRQAKLTGYVTEFPENASPALRRSLTLENKTAKDLVKAGIDVEQNPKVPGRKNPDYMIEGVVWDCYAPIVSHFDGIRDGILKKINAQQAFHIVVNMTDSPHGIKKLVKRLEKNPVPGLKGLMIVDKYGNVKQVF